MASPVHSIARGKSGKCSAVRYQSCLVAGMGVLAGGFLTGTSCSPGPKYRLVGVSTSQERSVSVV